MSDDYYYSGQYAEEQAEAEAQAKEAAHRQGPWHVIYHKQCRDCGQFLPRDRWVRTDDPYKAHGLCRDCGIMYDDPAFM